jgi:hypothetical protein
MSTARGTSPSPPGGLVRPLLVAIATIPALATALPLCTAPLLETRGRLAAGTGWDALPMDLVIASVAAAALGLSGLWLAAVTLSTVVEALTGRSWSVARAVTPLVVRRGVLAFCGLALGSAGVAVPAAAAPLDQGPAAVPTTAAADGRSALDGLPLPDRAEGGAPEGTSPRLAPDPRTATVAQAHRPTGTGAASTPTTLQARAEHPVGHPVGHRVGHRVRAGESLWSIASALLPEVDAAQVDRTWRRIYRANRVVIGDDPDLLLPGTILHVPVPPSSAGRADGPRAPGTSTHRKDAS